MARARFSVRKQILECTSCELSSRTGIKPVPWSGPAPCKIAIVGEAPGAQENLEGRPFIGAAGLVLDEALKRAGIKRREVAIMNVVCCFPNGTPQAWHIGHCRKNLKDQFGVVKPKYVLLLGNIALRAFSPVAPGITITRGKWWNSPQGRLMFPTLHPAYILRNPGERGVFEGDIAAFAKLAGLRRVKSS